LCEHLIEGFTDDFKLACYSGSQRSLWSDSLCHLYSWQALSPHACRACWVAHGEAEQYTHPV